MVLPTDADIVLPIRSSRDPVMLEKKRDVKHRNKKIDRERER